MASKVSCTYMYSVAKLQHCRKQGWINMYTVHNVGGSLGSNKPSFLLTCQLIGPLIVGMKQITGYLVYTSVILLL